jgi:hypothetical protein
MKIMRTLAIAGVLLAGAVAQADGPFQFYPITPCRLVDTRATGGALAGTSSRSVAVRGVCGVPSTAKAVSVNLTVTQPTTLGYLTLYPMGGVIPTGVSTLNFNANDTLANGALVALGSSAPADLSVYAGMAATANAQFIVDVTGYFQ